MIVVLGIATLFAGLWTGFICFANGMRSSPGKFVGMPLIAAAWVIVAAWWLMWWLA